MRSMKPLDGQQMPLSCLLEYFAASSYHRVRLSPSASFALISCICLFRGINGTKRSQSKWKHVAAAFTTVPAPVVVESGWSGD
ncbi:MAG: hypothetical protein AB7P31_03335 [Steroidobacteraceae bacterium]